MFDSMSLVFRRGSILLCGLKPLRIIASVFTAVALLMTGLGMAVAKPSNVTDGEIALLPSFCIDTMGFKYGDASSNTSPKAKYWVGLMGRDFWHMHHYCWALVSIRRADSAGRPAQERRAYRESAVNDLGYVLQNSKPGFVMLPEVLVILGNVYLSLGNVGAADGAYVNARQLKPDYWPAYSEWVAYLVKSGLKPQAKQLARTGLEHVPDSKVLQDQYVSLGGALVDIVPAVKKAPRPEQMAEDSGAGAAPEGPALSPAASSSAPQ